MSRLENNIILLNHLEEYIKKYPDIRFGQALSNLNLATHRQHQNIDGQGEKDFLYEDIFYEEPAETLFKLRNP